MSVTTLKTLFSKLPEHVQHLPAKMTNQQMLELFFPREIVAEFTNKGPQISWLLNADHRNFAIPKRLVAMLQTAFVDTVAKMEDNCRRLLYREGRPAFNDGLRALLWSVKPQRPAIYDDGQDAMDIADRMCIFPAYHPNEENTRLGITYDQSPEAALARVILTLSISMYMKNDYQLMNSLWMADEIYQGVQDQDWSGLYQRGRRALLDGHDDRAYQLFRQAADKMKGGENGDQAARLFLQLGRMQLSGVGCLKDAESALKLLERAAALPEACYLLGMNTAGDAGRAWMEKAVAMQHPKAVSEMGDAYYYGHARWQLAADWHSALACYEKGLEHDTPERVHCAKMLMRICQEQADVADAGQIRLIVQQILNGHDLHDKRDADGKTLGFSVMDTRNAEDVALCYINGEGGFNGGFVKNLPAACRVVETKSAARALLEEAERLGDAFPATVVALLTGSGDDLAQAVEVIGAIDRIAKIAPDALRNITMYVRGDRAYTELLLDAAFADVDHYVKVQVCDPAADAMENLFSRAPLFLPCIESPDMGTVRLVVLGGGALGLAAVRTAMALPLPEKHAVELHVLCEDAEALEQAFHAACPGAADAPVRLLRIRPRFHACKLTAGAIHQLMGEARRAEMAAAQNDAQPHPMDCLLTGSYYILCTEDDRLNLQLATLLRRARLEYSGFERVPFIAVHSNDPAVLRLCGGTAANTDQMRYNNQNHYALHAFGAAGLYTWNALGCDVLESRARRIHLIYYGKPVEQREQEQALASYYRRQYNRMSSRAMAMGLPYRMFACGYALSHWYLYGMEEQERGLARAFDAWMNAAEEHLEQAARAEHDRWNCFMLSAGWKPCAPDTVRAFKAAGVHGHRHYLCRLHPFIAEWDELPTLLEGVKRADHEGVRVADPVASDREAALMTLDILGK